MASHQEPADASAPAPPRAPRGGLLRVLGLAFGLAVIIGNTIGVGIVRTPGQVAASLPDPLLIMALWIVGGLYALLGALSIAELGAMIPRSGGQYVFVRRALGEYPAFLVGWSDWISCCGAIATAAMVISAYAGAVGAIDPGHRSWLACGIVLAFAAIQWRGIRAGNAVQQATSLLKALVFALIIVVCLALPPARDVAAATAVETPLLLPQGMALFAAIILALQSVIYAYDGWTGIVYFGEEVRNPGRDIPRSMIGGVALVIAIYLLVNLAFLRALPMDRLAGEPFVPGAAVSAVLGSEAGFIVRILIMASLLSGLNALTLISPRVPLAMARDRLMPASMGRVNRGGTPTVALATSTAVALALIVTNSFETALALLTFFFVANYTLSLASVFVLRVREPATPRPFRAPGYPFTTGLALLGSILFLAGAVVGDWTNSRRSLILLAASGPVFLIVRRLRRPRPAGAE